ncbi:hypothetical protein BJ508DRAFT_112219 [Ascobolus immersus RN42]|uniref:Uncharacterized protein n=1 Tax=Ascobolus immersus RN42 TaxID=1160509 RepID=A0A3N4IBC7_ASCIM|nr:hypothetical protein BJ508DRAFT_112219 [Ascobolus immersus RN42]
MFSTIQKRQFIVDDATWTSVRKEDEKGEAMEGAARYSGSKVLQERQEEELVTAVVTPSEEPTSLVAADILSETASSSSTMDSEFTEFRSKTLEKMENMTSKQTILTVVISLLGALVIGLLVLVVLMYKKRRAVHKTDVHLIPDVEKQSFSTVRSFDSRLRRLSSPRPKTAGKSPKMGPLTPKSTKSSQSTIVASPPIPQQGPVTPKTPRSPPLPPKPVSKPKAPMPKEVADEVTDARHPFDKLASPSVISPSSTNKPSTFLGFSYRSSKRSPGADARTAIELPTEISRPSSRVVPTTCEEPLPTYNRILDTKEVAQLQRSRSKSMSANRPPSVPPSVMKMALEMQRRKTLELGDREDLQRLLVPASTGGESKRSSKRISNIPGVPIVPAGANTRFSAILVNIDAQEKIPIPEPSPAFSIMSDNSVLKSPKYKFGGRKSRSNSVAQPTMETIPAQNERASPDLKGGRRSFSAARQNLPQIAISAPPMPRRASAGQASVSSHRSTNAHFSAPPVPALPDIANFLNKSPELKSTPKMTPSKCPTPTAPIAPQSGTIERNRSPSPEKLYPTVSSTSTFNLFPTVKSIASSDSTSPTPSKRYTAYTARSSMNSVGGHLIDRDRNLLFSSPSPPSSAATSPNSLPIAPPLPSPSQFPEVPPVPRIPMKHNSSYVRSPPMRPESYGQVRKAATAPNSRESSPKLSSRTVTPSPTPSPPLPRVPDQPPMLPEFTARMRDTVYSLGGFFQNVGRS